MASEFFMPGELLLNTLLIIHRHAVIIEGNDY
jgi:hypothetical protein